VQLRDGCSFIRREETNDVISRLWLHSVGVVVDSRRLEMTVGMGFQIGMGIGYKIGNGNGKEWESIAREWEGVGI